MSLLKKVSSWFSKKQDSSQQNVPEVVSQVEENGNNTNKRDIQERCTRCGEFIGSERYRYIAKQYFHKKCFKEVKRLAMNGGALNG